MTKQRFKYLEPEDIRKLSSYEFAPKLLVEGYLAGRHISTDRGLSTEFMDYRQYAEGDDPSMIDWKVFARTERYYVKTYQQETNTCCYVFLDSSASMDFGRKLTKLEYASFFTAALCYLVSKSDNQVGLQIFDDKIRHYFQPGSTGTHLKNLMTALEKNYAGAKTSLSTALKRSFPLLKRRGTLIIISDFFDDPAAIFHALSPYLHRGFKVYLFHVLDREELEIRPDSLTLFRDMETGEQISVHAGEIKEIYKKSVHEYMDNLRKLAFMKKVDYTTAFTDTHYFKLFDRLVK